MKNEIPVAGCAHQAGTCRFGTDPATSVLDVDCKAHELDNLYVVDTSVFPSIGAVNPALTAMANSLRVGDHLLERLGATVPVAGGGRCVSEAGVATELDQIEIARGEQRVGVVALGGGLRSYEAAGRELLNGFRPGERPTSGRGQVLVPWPNRIEDGSYEFEGKRLQLPLNEPENGNAIHGLVRGATWNLVDREPAPGGAGLHARAAARLPVHARSQHRVRPLGGRPRGDDDGLEPRRARTAPTEPGSIRISLSGRRRSTRCGCRFRAA